MPKTNHLFSGGKAVGAEFVTTKWNLVAQTGSLDDGEARAAYEELCKSYWYPLYVFVRSQGYSSDDAKDHVQGFLATVLERGDWARSDRKLGRFRSYLLGCLKHYLSRRREYLRAQKRGGGQEHMSLDAALAETRYMLEPADHLSPDRLYDRRWALTVLEKGMERLRQEYVEAGKGEKFEVLKQALTGGERTLPYAAIGDQIGSTEENVKVLVHRLRKRYREVLRMEIAETVLEPREIDEELRELMAALA